MNKLKLFLRSTIGNIYFYPALMIGLSLIVIIGIFSRKKSIYFWDNYIHRAVFKISLKLYGIEVEVRGKEYINPKQIYASKHESAMETYLYTAIVKNSAFVMKKELTYIPIFGWAQAVYGMIPIDRKSGGKAMRDMLKEAKGWFSPQEGGICCEACRRKRVRERQSMDYATGIKTASGTRTAADGRYQPEKDGLWIGTSTIYTMQYILATPLEKLFTFAVSEEVLSELANAMERFLEHHVGQKMKSEELLEMF